MKEAIRPALRGPLPFVVVAAAVVLIALAIVEALGGQARPEPDPPWVQHLKSMDEALAAGNIRAADWALREAHWAALGSRRWEGMIEVGDAARRAGNITVARTAYLTAAFRARRLRSLEGTLSAAEAFARLGDREVAEQWLNVATELAKPTESELARVQALADNLHGRVFAVEAER